MNKKTVHKVTAKGYADSYYTSFRYALQAVCAETGDPWSISLEQSTRILMRKHPQGCALVHQFIIEPTQYVDFYNQPLKKI